jgi:hypothetical protein
VNTEASAVEDLRGTVLRGATLALVAALLGAVAPPGRAAQASDGLSSIRLRELLRAGPVALNGARITETLDLRDMRVVRQPFTCRNCTFLGGIRAPGVVFERTFDLSGTSFKGPVDLEQARFLGVALFGSPPAAQRHRTTFHNRANFSLARFDDLVTFQWAKFDEGADFTLARFGANAIFGNAEFGGPPLFERAPALFERALFGSSVDFGDSLFWQVGDFRQAAFAGDAVFLGATFTGLNSKVAAIFERATGAGGFNFTFATIQKASTFRRLTATGGVSFEHALLPSRTVLTMDGLAAHDLFMSVSDVTRSVKRTNQRAVLNLIESSADARSDLGTANDALYAKRQLISSGYPLPQRVLDAVVYRGIAGYLVRPLRPLLALLALVAAGSLYRLATRFRTRVRPLGLRRLGRGLARWGHEVLDTLALVFSRGGAASESRRIEILVYRILLVCALFGLANSNPTLRQMVDALH